MCNQSKSLLVSVVPFVLRNWISIAVGFTFFKIYHFYNKRSKYPPGPMPLPYIGNLPALAMAGGSFYEAALEWTKVYGDIFTIWIGEKPWIFINAPDVIAECNRTPLQNSFAGRIQTNTGDVQMQGNVGVIFSDFGAAQQTVRSVAQQAIRKFLSSRQSRRQKIDSIVDAFIEENGGVFMESKQIAEEIMQTLATHTIFGSQLDCASQRELREAHRGLEENCPSGLPSDVLPIFRYFFWLRERAGMNAFLRYNKIARDLCKRTAEAYSLKDPQQIDCVMDAVQFSAKQPSLTARHGQEHLTSQNILQIAFDLFEAGNQTSAIALHWALLQCAKDQPMQERIHQEIMAFVKEAGRLPDTNDKHCLPLLRSFLKEVLRFWPAAPFGLPRKLLQSVIIGQHCLPKGSTILFNLVHANRDPTYWSDGHVFKAERFLDAEGCFDDRHQRGFLTFGLGSRACVGSQLAHENLLFVMTRILEKCSIHPASEDFQLTPSPAALMFDAKIQQIKLQPREAS